MSEEATREQQLEDQVELLRQQVQALTGSDQELGVLMALRHGITHRMAIILQVLVRRAPAVVPRTTFHTLVYGDRSDGGPEPKIFDVHISRLRKFLRRPKVGCPLNAKIDTVWNAGYRASPELVTWVKSLYDDQIPKED